MLARHIRPIFDVLVKVANVATHFLPRFEGERDDGLQDELLVSFATKYSGRLWLTTKQKVNHSLQRYVSSWGLNSCRITLPSLVDVRADVSAILTLNRDVLITWEKGLEGWQMGQQMSQ